MKKLVIASIAASLPLIASTSVQAAPRTLVNEDGSKLSELCVVAAQSEGSVTQLAKSMGFSATELSNIACNGEPLMSFVRTQRRELLAENAVNYSFNQGDSSMETQLCIAAVTEPEKYEALMPQYQSKNGAEVDKVLCNSQPLDTFVRRYGSPSLSSL